MRLNKWLVIGGGVVLLLLLVAALLAGNYFFRQAVVRARTPDTTTPAAAPRYSDGREEWLAAQPSERIEIMSEDGLKLSAIYIAAQQPAGRTVIIAHGYTADAMDMLGIARMFVEDLGYSVLLPDLRAHGHSEGTMVGFGWLDRKDMLRWLERVLQKRGKDEQVVLYGISMGAATMMMTAGEDLPKQVKAIVADCGYTSAMAELSHQMGRMYRLPSFPLAQIASGLCKLKAGYFFGEASAVKQLRKNSLPVLFIHGEADDFVPYAMLDELYAATRGEKARYTVPGAGHAQAYGADHAAYAQALRDFLQNYIQVD